MDHNKLWKILQEMGIADHLTCLLRNLYAGQEATVRNGHGRTDWFQRRNEPLDESERGVQKVALKLNQKPKIMTSDHFMANRWGNNGNSDRLYIWRLQNHCRW